MSSNAYGTNKSSTNTYECIMIEALELINQMRKDKEFIQAKKTLEKLIDFDIVKEDPKLVQHLKGLRSVLIRDIQSVLIKLREEKKKWNKTEN